MAQFWSFEETLAIVGALSAAWIAYKFFKTTALTSAMVGLITAFAVAYLTFFEFTLEDGVITYRNRFRQDSFPVSWVIKVGMHTHWAGVGLPGHVFMFVMRHPPAPWSGYYQRTGLVSWSSASEWVDTANAAAQEAKPPGERQ